jgi:sulfoxide reductase heme-binding subunit YedZ
MIRYFLTALFAAVLLSTAAVAIPAATAAAQATNSGNVVVETVPGQTVTQKVIDHTKLSWPWYLIRGSGIVAAVSLVILIVSGIGQVTGFTYKFFEPLTAWASHRALGIVFGVSVVLHIGGLLFDHFLPFTLGQILVPWVSHYKPVTLFGHNLGSLYVAMGVIAFYLTALVVITSLVWVEKKPHLWKWLHLFSYVIILLVFVHALYLGTDTAHGVVRWVWIASAVGIAAATIHRLWRAYTT